MLGGDEFGRTQHGNNNAYCHDNELSWFDWTLPLKQADLVRFTRELIALRLSHPSFRRPEFFTGKDANFNSLPDIAWFAPDGSEPDWHAMESAISVRLDGSRADIVADRDDNDFFIMFNATDKAINFKIPAPQAGWAWHRSVDTFLPSPEDIAAPGSEIPVNHRQRYHLEAKSLALLLARTKEI